MDSLEIIYTHTHHIVVTLNIRRYLVKYSRYDRIEGSVGGLRGALQVLFIFRKRGGAAVGGEAVAPLSPLLTLASFYSDSQRGSFVYG